MSEVPNKSRIELITLLIAIAAVVISLYSLEYSRESARSAVAQVRPQLRIYGAEIKQNGDSLTGKFFIENIGQTTAIINETRLMLSPDATWSGWYSVFKGAIIYKNGSREVDFHVSTAYNAGGRQINYLDQIKRDGGLSIVINFECLEMPGSQFVDSLITSVVLK